LPLAPDRSTWSGERDFVLLTVAYNTGARVSELVALNVQDVEFEKAKAIRVLGKGRKLRSIPLWKSSAALLKSWITSRAAAPLD
jgi:integrase/recombinase XerD